jgi:hypothetical protein
MAPDSDNRPLVVCLTGVAEAGKDTVAGVLSALHGFQRLAFADPIRGALSDLGAPTMAVQKQLEKAGRSVRWGLQRLGTECREEAGAPLLWAQLAAAKLVYMVKYHPVPCYRFAVSDTSYPHEAAVLGEAAARLGGSLVTVRVEREGAGDIPEAAHLSETGRRTMPADFAFRNPGTREALVRELGLRLPEWLAAAFSARGGDIPASAPSSAGLGWRDVDSLND